MPFHESQWGLWMKARTEHVAANQQGEGRFPSRRIYLAGGVVGVDSPSSLFTEI